MATRPEEFSTLHDEGMRRIEEEATKAIQEARRAYAQSELPMVGWRNGRIVWVDPVTLDEVTPPEPGIDESKL